MRELYEGPIPRWQMSNEDWSVVEDWRENRSETNQIRAEALVQRCYIYDFLVSPGDRSIAVGFDIDYLAEYTYRRTGDSFFKWPNSPGDFARIDAYLGEGTTRTEMLKNVLDKILYARANETLEERQAKISRPVIMSTNNLRLSSIAIRMAELGVVG